MKATLTSMAFQSGYSGELVPTRRLSPAPDAWSFRVAFCLDISGRVVQASPYADAGDVRKVHSWPRAVGCGIH